MRQHYHQFQEFSNLILSLSRSEIDTIRRASNALSETKEKLITWVFANHGISASNTRMRRQFKQIICPDFELLAIEHVRRVQRSQSYERFVRKVGRGH